MLAAEKKDKVTPLGASSMRSQVSYRAAQRDASCKQMHKIVFSHRFLTEFLNSMLLAAGILMTLFLASAQSIIVPQAVAWQWSVTARCICAWHAQQNLMWVCPRAAGFVRCDMHHVCMIATSSKTCSSVWLPQTILPRSLP